MNNAPLVHRKTPTRTEFKRWLNLFADRTTEPWLRYTHNGHLDRGQFGEWLMLTYRKEFEELWDAMLRDQEHWMEIRECLPKQTSLKP